MTLCPGDTSTATVAIYNSGSFGWVQGVLGQVAYLGTWNPTPGQDQPSSFGGDGQFGSPNTGWPRYNRVAAQPAPYVAPGQVSWFQFTVKAPQVPGSYGFYIRPLIEGAQWMEDFGIFWQITVPGASETSTWTRGVYLRALVPATGLTADNTRLVSVTSTLQRSDIQPSVAWLYTGPWSPDGTAVVGGDRTGHSYVIWPDSLVGLPTQTNWTWTDLTTVSGVAPGASGGAELWRANARSGQLLTRQALTNVQTQSGAIASPHGDWVSFSTSVPDFFGEAVTASTAGARVSSGAQTQPVGWLPDGRFVFIRLASGAWTVEVRDPARPDATVVGRFTDLTDALAQPSADVIVANDIRTNRLWTIRGTTVAAVPLQSAIIGQITLDSISRDGHTLSFSQPGSGAGQRTGIVDLQSGAVTFMCDGGCLKLVIN